jgi:acetone carboxylase gamma subunit
MKCVCGYESEKERFIEAVVADYKTRDGSSYYLKTYFPDKTFGQRRLYACPKCGTLKIEVKK